MEEEVDVSGKTHAHLNMVGFVVGSEIMELCEGRFAKMYYRSPLYLRLTLTKQMATEHIWVEWPDGGRADKCPDEDNRTFCSIISLAWRDKS